MRRTISAKIEFLFDEDLINEGLDEKLTDEELISHCLDTFLDDVYSMVKFNELHEAVRVKIEETGSL